MKSKKINIQKNNIMNDSEKNEKRVIESLISNYETIADLMDEYRKANEENEENNMLDNISADIYDIPQEILFKSDWCMRSDLDTPSHIMIKLSYCPVVYIEIELDHDQDIRFIHLIGMDGGDELNLSDYCDDDIETIEDNLTSFADTLGVLA